MARRIPNRRGSGSSGASAGGQSGRPSREDVLAFLAAHPDRAAKREIARHFGLKGEDRIWLKDLLVAFEEEGILERRGKKLIPPGALPPVAVLEIFARDADGDLIARPTETAHASDTRIAIRQPRGVKGPVAGVGERVLARIFANEIPGGVAYTARIMKVLEKRRDAVLGVVRRMNDGSFRIEPTQRRQPELVIETNALNGAVAGDLVEVEETSSGRHGPPRGRVVAVLGSMATERALSTIAIHAHDIPHVFPQAVLAEADAARPATMENREDWRDLPLITIDPADAKDHDDAVHAVADDSPANVGGFVVTVAIADVAAYVRPGSPLDAEARRRGNSVYFPDREVPMLPERISNDLCSLREGEDRPALAVRMVFAADGRKIDHRFHRIMMRSAAKLAYAQAQAAIDGDADEQTAPLLGAVLRPLWDAYTVLRRGRGARQPLELDLPERKILLKPDGTVDRVFVPPRLDAHKLIEEFMIQANVAAAETLEAERRRLLYRIHDAPSLAKQEGLREFLGTLGLSLARGPALRPAQFNQILAKVAGAENEQLVNQVVLRAQSQAEYAPDNIGHFGLNLRRYAHFTSPIRRYADLIVHRALIAALSLGDDGLTRGEEESLAVIGADISAAERRAMAAERDTVDRLIATHLAGQVGAQFQARVTGVTKAGLFVQLPEYGADGFVPISTLGDDYYIYDEAAHAVAGQRSGKGWQLGDIVEVRLLEVAPMAGAMRFEMLAEPKPLPGLTRSFHKAKRGAARGRPTRGRGRAGSRR